MITECNKRRVGFHPFVNGLLKNAFFCSPKRPNCVCTFSMTNQDAAVHICSGSLLISRLLNVVGLWDMASNNLHIFNINEEILATNHGERNSELPPTTQLSKLYNTYLLNLWLSEELSITQKENECKITTFKLNFIFVFWPNLLVLHKMMHIIPIHTVIKKLYFLRESLRDWQKGCAIE